MAEPRIIDGATELKALVGQEIGVSDWLTVGQTIIDEFGRVTGDMQWIHVDPMRASSGPFGGTIAHGFLVLSLIPRLANTVYEVGGFATRINYGLEKVRFPQPLRAGDRVRDRVSISSVQQTPRGVGVTFTHRLESDQGDRPVCVAEMVILFTS